MVGGLGETVLKMYRSHNKLRKMEAFVQRRERDKWSGWKYPMTVEIAIASIKVISPWLFFLTHNTFRYLADTLNIFYTLADTLSRFYKVGNVDCSVIKMSFVFLSINQMEKSIGLLLLT